MWFLVLGVSGGVCVLHALWRWMSPTMPLRYELEKL